MRAHQTNEESGVFPHQEQHLTGGRYIRPIVYGGLDGICTTFAIVAAAAGSDLTTTVVLVLGIANVIADGISMGIGDFLSTRAENEYNCRERLREEWETENYIEGEKTEMIELYVKKGLSPDDAKTVIDILSKNKSIFVDFMMVEELGILEDADSSPLKSATVTFLSFCIFGFVPLLAYICGGERISPSTKFYITIALTAITMFMLGIVKARFSHLNWILSGMQVLVIGACSAGSAYLIGWIGAVIIGGNIC